MEITEFAFRLMLLFFPGIVCFYVVDTLSVHKERPPHEVLLRSFVYGILAYVVYGLILACLNIDWLESTSGLDFPNEVSATKSFSDSKFGLNITEIGFVTLIAVVLGLAFSYAIAHKWPNDFGQWTGISKKFGDANVWSRAFNSKDAKWATVRDLQSNMMFSGYVLAFSDVEEVAELLLSQVIVYNEATGAELYKADYMYLSRPKDCLTVEIPNPPADNSTAAVEPPPPSEPEESPTNGKAVSRKKRRRK